MNSFWFLLLLLAFVGLMLRKLWRRRSSAYSELLQDTRWKALRRQFLAEHPDCVLCPRPATQVHHRGYIQGLAPWDPEYLRRSWLTPLCAFCHYAYTLGFKELRSRRRAA